MKILFVTGGDDCFCRGDGTIQNIGAWGSKTNTLCDCVEAREAHATVHTEVNVPQLLDGRIAYRAVLQRMQTANPEDPAESLLPVDVLTAALPVAQEKGHTEAVEAIQRDFDTHIRIKS